MVKIQALVLAMATLFIVACGSDGVMDKQQDERSAMADKLPGTYVSAPTSTGSQYQVTTVTMTDSKMTQDVTTYDDVEMTTPIATVSNSGTYALSNNYKEGINNSIIWVQDPQATFTFFLQADVGTQNGTLDQIRTAPDPTQDPGSQTPIQQEESARKAKGLSEAKQLSAWQVGQAKTLDRLECENISGFSGFTSNFGLNQQFPYQYDNGYLILNSVVYKRK